LRNGEVDFHGQNLTNATHQSTTDPEAKLIRKGKGKEAKLAQMGHVLSDNRNGLIITGLVAAWDCRSCSQRLRRRSGELEQHDASGSGREADGNFTNRWLLTRGDTEEKA